MMRLIAVPLGFAWLLARECEAAALNAARSASQHLALSDVWSAPAAVVSLAQGGNKTKLPGPDIVKAEKAAFDDFVRRCEVVVTVSDDKFLPVKPLDRFCETTDAAMECRMKVGMRLKETHARDGDMGKFCAAVYDWFSGKYGSKCPAQCRKLQCKSTCMWLDAKKKLNVDSTEIKDEMKEAEDELKHIKELGGEVSDKIAEEKKRNFTIKMIKVKIGRAQENLAEKIEDLEEKNKKKKKFDEKAELLEMAIAKAKESLINASDSIMKQKFAIDKAMIELENRGRAAQRTKDKAKEARAEEKSLDDDMKKLGKSMADEKKEKGELEASMAKDAAAALKQSAVVKAKVGKMKEAWTMLEKYKVKALRMAGLTNSTPRGVVKGVKGLSEEVYYFKQGAKMAMLSKHTPDMTSNTQTVNFGVTRDKWAGKTSKDNFAIQWSGYLNIEKEGPYEFSLTSDDGSLLYIDGDLIVNNDGLHEMAEKKGQQALLAGRHSVVIDYFQGTGASGMIFSYKGDDTDNTMKVVPADKLEASTGAKVFLKSSAPAAAFVSEKPLDWQTKYKEYMYGDYVKKTQVGDIKELVKNQFNRAMAAQKILQAIEKKMKDTDFAIKGLNLKLKPLEKEFGEVGLAKAAAKLEGETLEAKAKKQVNEAALYKAANVTAAIDVLDITKAAEAKEKASREKAKKTLKFVQGLQSAEATKVTAATQEVETAQGQLAAQKKDLKEAEGDLKTTQKELADLKKEEKEKKEALDLKELAMGARIKDYKKREKDLDHHKPEIVSLHALEPEE